MSLNLVPTIKELDHKTFEHLLNICRIDRLKLQTEYQQANNARLNIQRKKDKEKVTKQMEILAKEIMSIDDKLAKAKERMQKINIMINQVNHISSLLEENETD